MGTTTLSKAREVSQGKAEAREKQNDAKTKPTKSKGDEANSPSPQQDPYREAVLANQARPLPWQLAPHLRSESPLSPLPPWGKDSGDIPVVACRSL